MNHEVEKVFKRLQKSIHKQISLTKLDNGYGSNMNNTIMTHNNDLQVSKINLMSGSKESMVSMNKILPAIQRTGAKQMN